eukprot:CAMPEP_0179157026 /NCGR_PEP_ID=MMETSP0796-20121207/76573_1 /TAXON_ID=73915 /ORGANISM="Pyrodinium bahamense, Strain pbaha01" /LENGTH=42 /DNA_ID= /DNA_START= /DNA_END= /DNA_ORIENTATION=
MAEKPTARSRPILFPSSSEEQSELFVRFFLDLMPEASKKRQS